MALFGSDIIGLARFVLPSRLALDGLALSAEFSFPVDHDPRVSKGEDGRKYVLATLILDHLQSDSKTHRWTVPWLAQGCLLGPAAGIADPFPCQTAR